MFASQSGATCAPHCGVYAAPWLHCHRGRDSGKTTLREDLQERIREEHKPVVLIQPYARARARATGNPMQPTHIEAAMYRALGAGVPRKSNPDDRSAKSMRCWRAASRRATPTCCSLKRPTACPWTRSSSSRTSWNEARHAPPAGGLA